MAPVYSLVAPEDGLFFSYLLSRQVPTGIGSIGKNSATPSPFPGPQTPGFDWAARARPRVGLVRAGIAPVRVRGSGCLREGLK
jgi:hypothetical protein